MSDGARKQSPGAAGRPQPGSQHDDSRTETIAEGPDTPRTDGVPGADGNPGTVGGPVLEVNMEGKGAEVDAEMEGKG
ncbi:MAG: hypothetical protein IT337_14945 [Thermomicrobiales bacterium]|nr:hypothetical protein [Thermomicrobiales bacterium]